MTADEKYNQELTICQIVMEDVQDALESGEKIAEEMLAEEKTINQVREWNKERKEKIKEFQNMRKQLR